MHTTWTTEFQILHLFISLLARLQSSIDEWWLLGSDGKIQAHKKKKNHFNSLYRTETKYKGCGNHWHTNHILIYFYMFSSTLYLFLYHIKTQYYYTFLYDFITVVQHIDLTIRIWSLRKSEQNKHIKNKRNMLLRQKCILITARTLIMNLHFMTSKLCQIYICISNLCIKSRIYELTL